MEAEWRHDSDSGARIICKVEECTFHGKDDSCRRMEYPVLEVVHHGRVRCEFVCRGFEDEDGA